MIFEIDNDNIQQPIPQLITKAKYCVSLSLVELETKSKVNVLSQVLPKCTALAHLILTQNRLSSAEEAKEFGKVLSQCTQLESLSFLQNKISNSKLLELIDVLPQLPKLSVLFFNLENISNIGAKKLAEVLPKCNQLSTLVLWSTGIADAGAIELAKVLPYCLNLQFLDMSVNYITDASVVEFGKVLPNCYQLTRLNLFRNQISVKGVQILADVLRKTCIQSMHLLSYFDDDDDSDNNDCKDDNDNDELLNTQQQLIDAVIKYNIIRKERSQLLIKSFQQVTDPRRQHFKLNKLLSKQDFMDFRLWEKNNKFWCDSISESDEKNKTIISKIINNYINEHFLEITRIVKSVKNMKKNNCDINQISLHDLPVEILRIICSYVKLEDVHNL